MTDTQFETIRKTFSTLSIAFKNEALLKNAFIHRSYLNEKGRNLQSNERLEFLGDSILSFCVSQYLFLQYPDYPEGKLTNLRSTIVKTTTLAQLAETLKFGSLLYLSRGEEEGGGRENPSLLADAFEAFLGALFLDQGIEAVEHFLRQILYPNIADLLAKELNSDYKSKLQEVVQTFSRLAPTYKVVKSEGPDHAKTFWVTVVIDGKDHEVGTGHSKQEAEQAAAAKTLEKMDKL